MTSMLKLKEERERREIVIEFSGYVDKLYHIMNGIKTHGNEFRREVSDSIYVDFMYLGLIKYNLSDFLKAVDDKTYEEIQQIMKEYTLFFMRDTIRDFLSDKQNALYRERNEDGGTINDYQITDEEVNDYYDEYLESFINTEYEDDYTGNDGYNTYLTSINYLKDIMRAFKKRT